MNRLQFTRCLRIGTSAFFAVIAVALCVLWVRSDRHVETLGGLHGYKFNVTEGSMHIAKEVQSPVAPTTLPVTAMATRFAAWMPSRSVVVASIPLWIPVVISGLIATTTLTPWLTWHFSLRTLLIATTLVAVVLGLAAWAVRQS